MITSIKYYSTNFMAPKVSFKEALLKGLAPDRGLYMPDALPEFSVNEINGFKNKSYHEIAFEVLRKFLHEEVEDQELARLTKDAYDFDVPLEQIDNLQYVMRLDRGPTASFKDFAARMMGRLMQLFLEKENRQMTILTATSGDTGSAIANAFYGLDNIKVVVLFPEKEITDRQRKQMTTLGKNISIVAVDGKFDDCQKLVKMAFSDKDLEHMPLSSANSINIGRLLPQSVYYVYAASRLINQQQDKVIFSVPSGNFGNLMGGLLAKKMGAPIERFVVATNENDEVPVYFKSGVYKLIVPSKNCISSAMNVGHPSNMARVIALYNGRMDQDGTIIQDPDEEKMKKDLYGISISDQETRQMIKEAYENHHLLLEPHGAVAWSGIKHFLQEHEWQNNNPLVAMETAHPAKFPTEIREILNIDPELPASLKGLDNKNEVYQHINADYKDLKSYLLKYYQTIA